jgi:DNA processing protein
MGTDAAPLQTAPAAATDGLSEPAARVHDALPAKGSVTVAELMGRTGLTVSAVLRALGELDARGLVAGQAEVWTRRTPRRRAP